MDETLETPAPPVTAASIIGKFKQEKIETFFIYLAGGDKIEFRLPANADEYLALREKAARFAKMVVSATCPAAWKEFAPKTEEVAVQCLWVSDLAVNPPISQPEALEMARDCGALVPFLHGSLIAQIGSSVVGAEAEELDKMGEESPQTSSTETTSPSPETSITATSENLAPSNTDTAGS